MDRINAPGATLDNRFQDGDPLSGTDATVVNALWLNGVQEELIRVINAGGLTPNSGALDQLLKAFVNITRPIGSGFTDHIGSVNPNTLWPWQTWVVTGTGRTLVGKDAGQVEFDTVGKTGGEKVHVNTIDEMPLHGHPMFIDTSGSDTDTSGGLTLNASGSQAVYPAFDGTPSATPGQQIGGSGGGEAHNNLQPYQVVVFWLRTA